MRIRLLAYLIALCSPALSLAQYGTGTLLGTVKDSSGAVVPGVLVIARNAATSETREFRTEAEGNYRYDYCVGAVVQDHHCARHRAASKLTDSTLDPRILQIGAKIYWQNSQTTAGARVEWLHRIR